MPYTILFRQAASKVNRQLTGLKSMKHYFKALPTTKVNGLLTGLKSMKHYFKALLTSNVNGLLTGLVNEALF